MQPKKKSQSECPTARTLESVGEWWSILILRDAFQGCTRFEEFQRSLGIAPNTDPPPEASHRTGSVRATALSPEAGLVRIRPDRERPRFFPGGGRDFAWGNKHLSPHGKSLLMADRASAQPIDPIVVAAGTLVPVTLNNVVLVPGPKASRDMHRRLNAMRALRPDSSSYRSSHAPNRSDGCGSRVSPRLRRGSDMVTPARRSIRSAFAACQVRCRRSQRCAWQKSYLTRPMTPMAASIPIPPWRGKINAKWIVSFCSPWSPQQRPSRRRDEFRRMRKRSSELRR